MKNGNWILLALVALSSQHAFATNEGGGMGSGGGFTMAAGPALVAAANDLAATIRSADPALFANMPTGWTAGHWTQERLAQTVSNVCQDENATRSRTDDNGIRRRLVFDYCSGADGAPESCQIPAGCRPNEFGQYISALGRYFDINEGGSLGMHEIEARLLHEAAHLFGLHRDADARAFAERLLDSITGPLSVSVDFPTEQLLPSRSIRVCRIWASIVDSNNRVIRLVHTQLFQDVIPSVTQNFKVATSLEHLKRNGEGLAVGGFCRYQSGAVEVTTVPIRFRVYSPNMSQPVFDRSFYSSSVEEGSIVR